MRAFRTAIFASLRHSTQRVDCCYADESVRWWMEEEDEVSSVTRDTSSCLGLARRSLHQRHLLIRLHIHFQSKETSQLSTFISLETRRFGSNIHSERTSHSEASFYNGQQDAVPADITNLKLSLRCREHHLQWSRQGRRAMPLCQLQISKWQRVHAQPPSPESRYQYH